MSEKEKKILLVDDDDDFVELNRMMLDKSGYDVYTAASGSEGRKKALEVVPDLIVLDVMMETPYAGLEAARWLRRQQKTRDIPIIMLTGVNQEQPFNFGPDEGWLPVDEFLEKPVETRRLVAEVKQKLPVEPGDGE